jgi:tRNA threonylcarbamoyladenosine biosynthesis protein TsaE
MCVTPILTEGSFDIITHSARQTLAVGRRLGQLLGPGDVVCLQGELGSGKTCLTQGIGAGMEIEGTVRSPTFVLINEHESAAGSARLFHIDLYRISEAHEALAIGLDDYVYDDGVTVIEWAERAAEVLPDHCLWVHLTYLDDTKRSLHFRAEGEHYRRILSVLQQELSARRSKTRSDGE